MIQKSGLTISHSELSFTQTASDKPAYLLLTITQQLVDTPITLTTDDDPAYFQLASDSRPYYGSTLTVISSAKKFHVHVRYAADKRGLHKGQLIIQTPYESKTVFLEGRRKGWLPTRNRVNTSGSQPRLEAPKSASQLRSWVVLAILAGISGLGYVGYTHKCQLLPGLCQDAAPKVIVTKVPSPLTRQSTGPTSSPKREPKAIHRPEKAQENLTHVIDSLSQLRQSFPAGKSETERVTVTTEEQPAVTRPNDRRRETAKKTAGKPEERTRPKKPTLTNEESELEKALNKPL